LTQAWEGNELAASGVPVSNRSLAFPTGASGCMGATAAYIDDRYKQELIGLSDGSGLSLRTKQAAAQPPITSHKFAGTTCRSM
jgi:hypothetical protein